VFFFFGASLISPQTKTPKTPIPNPQSPSYFLIKKKIIILNKIIKNNKN